MSDKPASAVHPTLVGRERELAEFDAVLARRRPALVVVIGGPGMGKTVLLQEFAARAQDQGWRTVRSDAQGDLRIEPATTEDAFCTRVREALGIATDAVRVESPVGGEKRSPLHPLVEQLRSQAPVLVLVDGFRAESAPPAWFLESLLPGVQRAEAPIVLVVAECPPGAVLLSPLADEVISIGAFDPALIREHFAQVGAQIRPPFTTAEVDAYVEAARDTPEILDRLTRVFRFMRRQGGEPT